MESERKQVRGFWLPADETHLTSFVQNSPEFAGGPTYQLHKLLLCLPYIANFRHAIDVGAHCGLWTRPLAAMFSKVSAFEPIQLHRECLRLNTNDASNIEMYAIALGDTPGTAHFDHEAGSSGDTHIVNRTTTTASAEVRTLDQMDLAKPDFIKIDCEGFESFVLRGGEKLVKSAKPFILVEQKPGHGQSYGVDDLAACALLESWGMHRVFEIHGDFGYSFQTPTALRKIRQ